MNDEGADVLTEHVYVNVVRKLCVLVAALDQCEQGTEIVDSRQSLQTGAPVEEVVDLVDLHSRVAIEVQDDAWVDVAAAGAHDKTLERGEAHRGVDGLAALDCRGRSAVSEVQDYLIQLGGILAEELRDPSRHVFV